MRVPVRCCRLYERAGRTITTMPAFLYVLGCADDSYYVGTTRGALETRLGEHNAGHYGGFTAKRRPVRLLFAQEFDRISDAIAAERQVKGWRWADRKSVV